MKDHANIITEALSSLGVPAFSEFYDARAEYYDESGNKQTPLTEWITFNRVTYRPIQYADDSDRTTEAVFDVHLFIPASSAGRKQKEESLRAALREADFIIEESNIIHEPETNMIHIVVTVSDVEQEEI